MDVSNHPFFCCSSLEAYSLAAPDSSVTSIMMGLWGTTKPAGKQPKNPAKLKSPVRLKTQSK